MTRLVIDASVLLSATVAAPDAPPSILMRAARAGIVEMVVCERLVEEVRRGLSKNYFRTLITVEEGRHIIDALPYIGLMVSDPVEPQRVVRDPNDDYLVALARASNATAIVTGDKDLLDHLDLSPPAITPRLASDQWDLASSLKRVAHRKSAVPLKQRESQIAPPYSRLSQRPSSMDREEVRRSQRARVYTAMIESISQRGYQATSVAHVIAIAGVSRRAFSELFSDKERCFLVTHDVVVARLRKRVIGAWNDERGWFNRLHASCNMLLGDIAESPEEARLVLVDAVGIGSNARQRMLLSNLTFERLVAGAFQLAPDGVGLPRLTVRAIVGGVRRVVFTRVAERRERELYALADDVLDWIECYRTLAFTRLGVRASSPVRTSSAPAAFLARGDERSRVLSSVLHLTLDEGYSQLTEPQLARSAGLSIEVFHEQFPSKEECFLALLDEFLRETLAEVQPSCAGADTWSEGVYRAIVAFVEYLVAHEALTRIVFVDIFELGPVAVGRIMRPVEGFIEFLAERGPESRRGPRVAREAITGAVWTLISNYVASGRSSRLPLLVDHLAFIVLAPYVGPTSAVECIQSARRSPRRL